MRILTQLPSVVLLTSSDVRNYDAVGSSANPGPNAPLGDLCGTSTHPETSAQAGLKQWTAAGFPKDQLMLGLPLYGYVSKSTKTTLKERDTIAVGRRNQPLDSYRAHVLSLAGKEYAVNDTLHDISKERELGTNSEDDEQAVFANGVRFGQLDPVTNQTAEFPRGSSSGDLGAFMGQQIPFSELVAKGALADDGGKFTAINGYQYRASSLKHTCLSLLTPNVYL